MRRLLWLAVLFYAAVAWADVIVDVPSGSVVGDVVYFTDSATAALSKADVASTAKVNGVVKTKLTATRALIQTGGTASGFSGLSIGSTYYLSANLAGKITTGIPPPPARNVVIGTGTSSSALILNFLGNTGLDLQRAYDAGLAEGTVVLRNNGKICFQDNDGDQIFCIDEGGASTELENLIVETLDAEFATIDHLTIPCPSGTIAGGIVAQVGSCIRLATEGGVSTDDLDTITPAATTVVGTHLYLFGFNPEDDVIALKDGTGNLNLRGTDIELEPGLAAHLIWDGDEWILVGSPAGETPFLDEILDVDATDPDDGSLLEFDEASGNWIASRSPLKLVDVTASGTITANAGQFDTIADEDGNGPPTFTQGLTIADEKFLTFETRTTGDYLQEWNGSGGNTGVYWNNANAHWRINDSGVQVLDWKFDSVLLVGLPLTMVSGKAIRMTGGNIEFDGGSTNYLSFDNGTFQLQVKGSTTRYWDFDTNVLRDDTLMANSGFECDASGDCVIGATNPPSGISVTGTSKSDVVNADTIANEAGTGAPNFSQGLTVADAKSAVLGGPVDSDVSGGSSLGGVNPFLNGTFTGTLKSDVVNADSIANEAGSGAPTFIQGLTVTDAKTSTFGGPIECDASGGCVVGATNPPSGITVTGTAKSDVVNADTIANEAGSGAPNFIEGLTVADTKTSTLGGPVEVVRATGGAVEAIHIVNDGGSFINLEHTVATNEWFLTHGNGSPYSFFINSDLGGVGDGPELTLSTGGDLTVQNLLKGDDLQADTITNEAGTGAPSFTQGLTFADTKAITHTGTTAGFIFPIGNDADTGLRFDGSSLDFSFRINNAEYLTFEDSAVEVLSKVDFTAADWFGHGTPQAIGPLGAGATTIALTQSYATIDADTGGNTLGSASCTGCKTGDLAVLQKIDATHALTITDTASPGADQFALAGNFTMTAINSTLVVIRHASGYWLELGRSGN